MPFHDKPVSRRDFARNAAIGAASASLMPLKELVPPAPRDATSSSSQEPSQTPAGAPKLSAQSQTEAENRWKAILEQYSDRFTEAQKADLKRLCVFVQPGLDRVRAYAISNGNLPGLYLKPLVERDKKPAAAASGKNAAAPSSGKP